MLTNNFKTAAELGLREDVYQHLIGTLVSFEGGEIAYDPTMHTQPKGFNLGALVVHHDHGVCGCIFGWTAMAAGLEAPLLGQVPKETLGEALRYLGTATMNLTELFFGPIDREWSLEQVTLPQAITAIRNYLATGNASWNDIMSIDESSS